LNISLTGRRQTKTIVQLKIMKNNKLTLFLLIAVFFAGLTSCSDDDPELTVSENEISLAIKFPRRYKLIRINSYLYADFGVTIPHLRERGEKGIR